MGLNMSIAELLDKALRDQLKSKPFHCSISLKNVLIISNQWVSVFYTQMGVRLTDNDAARRPEVKPLIIHYLSLLKISKFFRYNSKKMTFIGMGIL